jgi:multiple sugar transport system ATP-binding protein
MARVQLERIEKRFEDVVVLKPIDLSIEDGEFLVLLGPSGCGKSTTLRLIAGLEAPTGGRIRIGERDVTQMAPKERDVAMVFQSYALYPHLSVRENLAFGLKVRKTARDEIERRTTEAAAMLGIGGLLDRKPKELSGGQRQRVAMGRALVRRPAVFLFDEPLSNLDSALRTQMRAEIASLHKRLKSTMIYVTHDQIEAMTLASRIVILDRGVVQQVGSPLEVYARPANAFVGRFLGAPPMNQLLGRIAEGPVFEGTGIRVPVPTALAARLEVGRPVLLGFRPQTMRPGAPGTANLSGEVELVEPTGGESFVRLKLSDDQHVTARVEGRSQLSIGERAGFDLDPGGLFLFEPNAGQEALGA